MSSCDACFHKGDHLDGPQEKFPTPCNMCSCGEFFTEINGTNSLQAAQRALSKLARADKRGTGTRLTAEEVRQLGITGMGELWDQPDPTCQTDTTNSEEDK